MNVYLNYPNPHMTLHGDSTCAEIRKMQKDDQRRVTITRASFTEVLWRAETNNAFLKAVIDRLSGFQLGEQARFNDVWFTINFGDAEFEEATARYVLRLLSQLYNPLRNAPINKHC